MSDEITRALRRKWKAMQKSRDPERYNASRAAVLRRWRARRAKHEAMRATASAVAARTMIDNFMSRWSPTVKELRHDW